MMRFSWVRLFTGILLTVFLLCAASALAETGRFSVVEGTPGTYGLEGPQSLLDRDIATKWCVKLNGDCYVIISAAQPVRINGYILYKGNDEVIYPDRSPHRWKLYGAVSDSAPKAKDKIWEMIDDHTDKQDHTMIENTNYNGYAFVFNSEIPEYNYFMLVFQDSFGSAYMQLSEVQFICENTLEIQLSSTANPEKAIVALGDLIYKKSSYELIPSEDVFSDRILLGGGLTPIKVPDIRTVRLRLKEGKEWPTASSVSVSISSAYDIDETRVGQLKYSQCVISVRDP